MKRRPSVWEWVGVSAIVLLIVAILFPVFIGTRDHSPRLSCLHNELQLGLALFQYSDNNDGLLPPVQPDVKDTWRTAVFNQVVIESIYKCPEDERDTPGPDGHFQSYAFNAGSVINTWRAKPQTIASVPNPNTLVLLCEVQNTDYAAFDVDDAVRFSPDKHILAVRHSGGGNYLLADGHAKWFRPSAFTTPAPAPGMMGTTIPCWHRDPKRSLSPNAVAVLADAQARAQ